MTNCTLYRDCLERKIMKSKKVWPIGQFIKIRVEVYFRPKVYHDIFLQPNIGKFRWISSRSIIKLNFSEKNWLEFGISIRSKKTNNLDYWIKRFREMERLTKREISNIYSQLQFCRKDFNEEVHRRWNDHFALLQQPKTNMCVNKQSFSFCQLCCIKGI